MKLLIMTQKVDLEDSNLGFFHSWLEKFASKLEEIYVICLWQGKYNLPENVKVFSLGKEKGIPKIGQLFRLQKDLIKILPKVDGVFVHMCPTYAIATFPLAKIFRKKMNLWYVHKSVNPILKLAEKCVAKILTASEESCQLESKKIKALGHGIQTNFFKPLDVQKSNLFNILFAGRIAPIKDLETLIEAMDILINRKQVKDWKLRIIGDLSEDYEKEYKEKIKKMVLEKRLENYVKFLGKIPYSKMLKFYQESDILVNLSPLGLLDKVVFEAMASGTPVLVSNQDFKKDLGIYAEKLIFKEKDAGDLAQKVQNLRNLNRSEVRNYLRSKVLENHNLNNLIDKIISEF